MGADIQVQSSMIKSIQYHEDSRILRVRFHNDNVYRYTSVPNEVYVRLINANSVGKTFNEIVKDKFRVEKE